MTRQNCVHMGCFLVLFATPFIFLIMGQETDLGSDSSEHRMWAWLLCTCTYMGYLVIHALYFGFHGEHYIDQYTMSLSLCTTSVSLLPFSIGMLWMYAYLHDLAIPLLTLMVVAYRLAMTAWYKRPYFNEKTEVRFELAHDILIIACFLWVGYRAGSTLWVAGAVAWIIYAILNQYHGHLFLRRGFGYASTVFSVAFSCAVFALMLRINVEVPVLLAYYGIIALITFTAPLFFIDYRKIRKLAGKYIFTLLLFPACIVVVLLSVISADSLVVDVSQLAPVYGGSVDLILVLLIGSFLGATSLCVFTTAQSIFLVIPGNEDQK